MAVSHCLFVMGVSVSRENETNDPIHIFEQVTIFNYFCHFINDSGNAKCIIARDKGFPPK